jgi:cytochrome P450
MSAMTAETVTDAEPPKREFDRTGQPLWSRLLGLPWNVRLDDTLKYGPICYFEVFGKRMYSLHDPKMIQHVVLDNAANYHKSPPYRHNLKPFLGNGLLINEGESWMRQRKLAQPAFHIRKLKSFVEVMGACADDLAARWEARNDAGAPVDMAADMMSVTMDIVARCMFGIDLRERTQQVNDAMTILQDNAGTFRVRTLFDLPAFLMEPRDGKVKRAREMLTDVVQEMIDAGRARSDAELAERDDLLSMLMLAEDEETGERMDDQQLMDEVMTIFLAGHETTALGLTWAWMLLDQHPEVLAKLREEVAETVGERAVAFDDLKSLKYTRAVFDETLRLFPPAYAFGRMALEDDVLGGFRIAAGSNISISPYIMHRHPDYWVEPKEFRPERFLNGETAKLPKYVYMPFGGGPRICIGFNFALMEAQIILAHLARRFDMRHDPAHEIGLNPGITLRPRGGMPMFVTPR